MSEKLSGDKRARERWGLAIRSGFDTFSQKTIENIWSFNSYSQILMVLRASG